MGDVSDGKCGVDDGVDGATAVMEQELVICSHYVYCQVFALFCKMFFLFNSFYFREFIVLLYCPRMFLIHLYPILYIIPLQYIVCSPLVLN